jgi:hypothetical protein
MHKFDKLLEKKGKKLSGLEQRAKSDVLSGLQSEGSEPMGEKLAGLKKVSVAAPSQEGLEQGLDKAKELLGEMPNGEEDLEMKPMEECTPEEIDQKIQMLMDYKNELLQKEQE